MEEDASHKYLKLKKTERKFFQAFFILFLINRLRVHL